MCFSFLYYLLSLMISGVYFYVNAESRRKCDGCPDMRKVEQHPRRGRPEEFINEAERSIGCHIKWVNAAGVLALFHSGNEQNQHHNIIEDLEFPCWKVNVRSRYD